MTIEMEWARSSRNFLPGWESGLPALKTRVTVSCRIFGEAIIRRNVKQITSGGAIGLRWTSSGDAKDCRGEGSAGWNADNFWVPILELMSSDADIALESRSTRCSHVELRD